MSGSEPITRKRWRPRLWQLIVGAFMLLVLATLVALLAVRANGRARWQAFAESERASGRSLAIEDFLAHPPALDPGVQAAWDAWARASPAAPYKDLHTALERESGAWDAWVTGHGPLPVAVPKLLADAQVEVAPALSALRSGKLVLNGFVSADHALAQKRSGGYVFLRGANELVVRRLAQWLRHHALLGDDPLADLSDLEALHTALAGPATWQDAHVANSLAPIRDRTYLELALRGRLPAAARERWLAEACRSIERLGDGLRGERVMMMDSYVTVLDVDLLRFLENHGSWHWRRIGYSASMLWLWVTLWDDLPPTATHYQQAATRLRDGAAAAPFPAFAPYRDSLSPVSGRWMLAPKSSHLPQYAVMAAEVEAGNRQARLAVHLLALPRTGGLPADQAEFRTRLGAAAGLLVTPERYALRYERLAADRFRLVIDPAAPPLVFDDPALTPTGSKAAGTPPATSPLVTKGCLEIHLGPTP